ncbi:PRA1 family protein [Quillaja saponaria]|uniref:PRA1 family protein n=1 Tax=Quillaja saponaria TaxID=32244 RepID=A0AAD7QED5_QUISA|nr:PRA1 family protein [Quillaja saponaria]
MSTSTEFLSGFKETGQSIIATRRPWSQLLGLSALSLPSSLSDATTRITQNVTHFFFNYTLIILIIIFLSLIYQPFSMIVFLIVFVGWYFLYFSRDDPLTLFNFVIEDRIVVAGLGIFTIVSLVWMHVWVNLVVSLAIGAVLVSLHAALRGTEDLVMDDQESPYGTLLSESPGAYTLA